MILVINLVVYGCVIGLMAWLFLTLRREYRLRKRPDESEWEYFERVTGHRFHDGPQNGSWCTRCGTAAEYWRQAHNLVGFIRSKCPGPYRTPRWVRIARWVVR